LLRADFGRLLEVGEVRGSPIGDGGYLFALKNHYLISNVFIGTVGDVELRGDVWSGVRVGGNGKYVRIGFLVYFEEVEVEGM
jgi:hypothetical protein